VRYIEYASELWACSQKNPPVSFLVHIPVVQDIVPVEAENIVVKQGYQEGSNVKMIDELVDMLMVSRMYEANMKFIAAQKEASSSLLSVAMG